MREGIGRSSTSRLSRSWPPSEDPIVPPDKRHVSGRDAIRAATEPIFALGPSVQIEVVGKVEADDLALTHAHWSMSATEGDQPVEMSERGTIVSRRQPDGSWRIVLENSMSFD